SRLGSVRVCPHRCHWRKPRARDSRATGRSCVLVRADGALADDGLARGIFHLDVSRKPGDRQLDREPRELGEPADPVGVLACRQCNHHLSRSLRRHDIYPGREAAKPRRRYANGETPMPRYLGALTIVLLLGMVLTRVLLLKGRGIKAM